MFGHLFSWRGLTSGYHEIIFHDVVFQDHVGDFQPGDRVDQLTVNLFLGRAKAVNFVDDQPVRHPSSLEFNVSVETPESALVGG